MPHAAQSSLQPAFISSSIHHAPYVCAHVADLILFGTGSRIRPLPPSVSSYLQQLGIGYEVLQSNNALATFNMLSEEQRLVMAALVPVGEEAGKKQSTRPAEELPSVALRRRIEEHLSRQE